MSGRAWSQGEIRALREGAGRMPLEKLARQLGRTEASVQIMASKIGVSVRTRKRGKTARRRTDMCTTCAHARVETDPVRRIECTSPSRRLGSCAKQYDAPMASYECFNPGQWEPGKPVVKRVTWRKVTWTEEMEGL